MAARILLVDDDDDILNINSIFLQREGYEILIAKTIEQAYAIVELENPDLIVLDILLVGGSGLTVCKNIRNFTIAPIIFLTSLLDDKIKIEALQIGGDDFMTKPYKLTELSARIYANLRRVQMHENKIYELSPLKVNVGANLVFLNEEEVVLTQKETLLLITLIKQRGTTVSANDLYESVWGNAPVNESNIRTLHVHISTLRKKLYMGEDSPLNIKTIRHIGYCLQHEGS